MYFHYNADRMYICSRESAKQHRVPKQIDNYTTTDLPYDAYAAMADWNAASIAVLTAVAFACRSAYPNTSSANPQQRQEDETRTGVFATSASSNALVSFASVCRSCATSAGMPPMGRLWNAGFFATMFESVSMMPGWSASTAARMVCASSSENAVVFCA